MNHAAHLIGFPHCEGDMLLDIPCGIGHLYPYVRNRFIYLGLDSSEEMLAVARNSFPEGDFRLGDIYNLKDYVKPDIIVCLSLFIHLPEPFKILKIINEYFFDKAIIGLQIGRTPIYREKPRGDKFLIIRRETMKTVKGWLKKLKIENYFIEKIHNNTHYLVIEK
jgi:trans-aconitate methyltransferase